MRLRPRSGRLEENGLHPWEKSAQYPPVIQQLRRLISQRSSIISTRCVIALIKVDNIIKGSFDGGLASAVASLMMSSSLTNSSTALRYH